MSKINSQVPPPSPPQPKPGKQPIPQGPIKQTRVAAESSKAKIRNRYYEEQHRNSEQMHK